MTEATLSNLPVRRVTRVGTTDAPAQGDPYVVFEKQTDGTWKRVSKDYPHSTSAFAAMGRMYQKDVEKLAVYMRPVWRYFCQRPPAYDT